MPSIFAKGRRASESCPPMPVPDESYLRNKRSSIDVSHLDKKDMRPPPSASAKFKAFLGTMGDRPEPDEAKRDSLRKRLSSPSTFFNKPQADGQSPPIPAIEAMDRYHNPAPRAALPNGAEYPSPTVFPENFSLSGTNSPEAASPRRGSVSWQPSYPLVVDDAYAEVPPDGRAPNGMVSPTTAMASENAHRRSNELLNTPSPEELSAWPAMKPASKPLTPPPTQAPLPTPPSSAVSQGRSPTQPARSSPAPRLSVNFNTGESNGLMGPQPAPTRFSSSDSPTALTPTNPAAPAVSRSRPDMPLRRPTLIQRPPMPQPIKNLPTLTGWQGFNKGAGGMVTPNWGALAKEGGPKTPGGMGGMMSNGPRTPGWPTMTPGGPKTPGLSGFPFSTTSVVQNNSRVKKAMSEDELRRAKRAMPVMLREPSFRPPNPDDGGEAGDSDESDGESDTEMENHGQDDSDGETETEPAASTARKTFLPMKSKLGGKGKGKAAASGSIAPSKLASSAVPEEDDGATGSASRRSTRPSNLRAAIPAAPPQGKSLWSLPTPTAREPDSFVQGSWMQFGASSPAATPEVDRQSGGAQAPAAKPSRVHSNTGSVQSSTGSSDGYFDSRPSSSIVTPRLADPVLSQGAGKAVTGPGAFGLGPAMGEPLAAPTAASNSPHDEGDDGDDSDEGSPDGSEGTSSLNHGSPAVPLPSQPTAAAASRSDTSQRPSFYSRTSQSMVNLSNVTSQPDGQIDADIARREDKASVAPQLETIRSREVAPRSIVLPPRTMAMANGMLSPNSEWTKAPPTPAVGLVNSIWGKSKAEETKPAPKRRRSADDLLAPPPAYEPPWPGVIIPRPRDEEGKEKLPTYWCAVHIEGTISRKMEFTAPGLQARDRGWKKLYCILHGTHLLVYKFDPHRYPGRDTPGVIPLVSEADSEAHLHVHVPGERRPSITVPINPATAGPAGRRESIGDAGPGTRRGSGSGPSPLVGQSPTSPEGARRASISSSNGSVSTTSTEKDASLFPSAGSPRRASVSTSTSSVSSTAGPSPLVSHFQHNSLVKQYTLQNAESGLAADYMKRKNVVRVRAEGEQFLLQTENARDVVDWIEAFQAATNVSLDLDDRPMPKIITLPRRRRRRPGASGTAVVGGSDANPPAADTPEGNGATVRAAEAAERDRERMLAEDQAAAAS